MADDIDRATDSAILETDALVHAVRRNADIPVGVKGFCGECEAFSQRLVGGLCAPCRDELGAP